MRIKFLFLILLSSSFLSFGQTNLNFEYRIVQDTLNRSIFFVEGEIINQSGQAVYFLSETCNGLDYYLESSSSKIRPYILIHCNATFPLKIHLEHESKFAFKTRFIRRGNLDDLTLTLTLVLLDESTNIKQLSISEIRETYTYQTIKLKGRLISIN